MYEVLANMTRVVAGERYEPAELLADAERGLYGFRSPPAVRAADACRFRQVPGLRLGAGIKGGCCR